MGIKHTADGQIILAFRGLWHVSAFNYDVESTGRLMCDFPKQFFFYNSATIRSACSEPNVRFLNRSTRTSTECISVVYIYSSFSAGLNGSALIQL